MLGLPRPSGSPSAGTVPLMITESTRPARPALLGAPATHSCLLDVTCLSRGISDLAQSCYSLGHTNAIQWHHLYQVFGLKAYVLPLTLHFRAPDTQSFSKSSGLCSQTVPECAPFSPPPQLSLSSPPCDYVCLLTGLCAPQVPLTLWPSKNSWHELLQT